MTRSHSSSYTRPAYLLVGSLVFLSTILGAPAQTPDADQAAPAPELKLELRVGDERTVFHLGEVIPVELIFSSAEHRKYPAGRFECFPHQNYHYSVDPPLFTDRLVEVDAAVGLAELSCCGPFGEIDPGEKPFKVQQTLNDRFRMETPGKYKIAVTSNRLGPTVTSNTVDLEILPSDPAWEEVQLERGIALLKSPLYMQEHVEGCTILRYLGTDGAELEMARRYSGQDYCDQMFTGALISARNRTAVLEQLKAGLTEPTRPISTGYLRTLAIVSLYEQHPEWYPKPEPMSPDGGSPQKSGLWSHSDLLKSEMLRYARLLLNALPQKAPDERALSLEALLYLGKFGSIEVPDDMRDAVRQQIPSVFRKLPGGDQARLMMNDWPEVSSPAMLPVLKSMIDQGPWFGPRGIVLRRIHDLSPAEARPYILRELRNPHSQAEIEGLALLPEKELPGVDRVMLDRVRSTENDVNRVTATGIVQRYASPAIAKSLEPLMADAIEHWDCQSRANLLAYFLRVNPGKGAQFLRSALQQRSTDHCRTQMLSRLAETRMSRAVEDAALASLRDPEPLMVIDALNVLQQYGSITSKRPLLQHFRQWQATWESRPTEFANSPWQIKNLDVSYLNALGAAQAWLSSKEELETLSKLCVNKECKDLADRAVGSWNETRFLITFRDPVSDETAESFGIGNWYHPGSIDRLKQKMTQYPKGSVFMLDSRFKEKRRAKRVYGELRPWALRHGFDLRPYQDQDVARSSITSVR
jgi:hypothetical protein